MASQTKRATPTEPRQTEADSEDLHQQIETIRKDISTLTDLIADMGGQRTESAARKALEKVTQLRARTDAAGNEVRERLDGLASRAQHEVRQQPGTALLIATGLGLLSGLLLTRR